MQTLRQCKGSFLVMPSTDISAHSHDQANLRKKQMTEVSVILFLTPTSVGLGSASSLPIAHLDLEISRFLCDWTPHSRSRLKFSGLNYWRSEAVSASLYSFKSTHRCCVPTANYSLYCIRQLYIKAKSHFSAQRSRLVRRLCDSILKGN